jgi:adenosylhomocysteine nucleosidase
MTSILFTFALPSESAHHFDDLTTLYTGVGKVNATLMLSRYFLDLMRQGKDLPSIVVNCGTVGSRDHLPGTVVQSHRFVQRDMDVTPLGFAQFQTPFDDMPVVFETTGFILPHLPDVVCGTGDHFVTNWPNQAPFDIVDMEAYALARACLMYKIPFLAIKYISDAADGDAHVDWGAALDRAAIALRAAVDPILKNSTKSS